MCRGTTEGEGILLNKNTFHVSVRDMYTRDIYVDRCIAEEVLYLLENGIATNGFSCCGHGRQQSQVWIHNMSLNNAEELGYRVFTAYTLCGQSSLAIMLNTGTQSTVLRYEGYIHGDENGMIDGKFP